MALQNITYLKPGEEGKIIEGAATQQTANLGLVPVVTPDTSKIDSSVFAPNPAIAYQEPGITTNYPIEKLDSTVIQATTPSLGTQETRAQSLTERLQDLNRYLVGESAFRAEQEQAAGVAELAKTQSDLAGRLKMIQAEAQAIPLQLQQEITGQGVTVGGLAPIQAGRLRANAIQALTTSSLLEASKGNISTALSLVDRAVSQKFDPIREEINVVKSNLEMIIKSPAYTAEQKAQAQDQLDLQNAKQRELSDREQSEKTILSIATEAAKNGADALTLQKISQATNPYQALQLASKYISGAPSTKFMEVSPGASIFDPTTGEFVGMAPKPVEAELDKLLTPTEAAALNVPYGTTRAQASGIMPKAELTGTEKISLETQLGKQYLTNTKDLREAQRQVGVINTSYKEALNQLAQGKGINAASQGIITAFNKLLDPTSVVRESEYARTPEGQSLLAKIEGKYTQIKQGGAGLTPESLREFVQLGNDFFANYQSSITDYQQLIQTQANNYKLNIQNILTPEALKSLNVSQVQTSTGNLDDIWTK